jgi:hypothetical protein
MKKNKLAFKLIDMGLKAETLSNLTESQLRLLYNKLNESKKETKEVEKVTTTKLVASDNEVEQGVSTQGLTNVKKRPDGKYEFTEAKKKGAKKKYNPFALCTASVGRKNKEKYERCVMGVKKSIKEGKDPVNLFLEEKILSLLEKHIQPKITKGEFLQMISETRTKEREKTRETDAPTKPGKTKPDKGSPYRPKHEPAPQAVYEFLDTETAPTKPRETDAPTKPGKPRKDNPYRPKHEPAPQAKTLTSQAKNLFPWSEVSNIAKNSGVGFITNYIK